MDLISLEIRSTRNCMTANPKFIRGLSVADERTVRDILKETNRALVVEHYPQKISILISSARRLNDLLFQILAREI